MDKKGVTGLPLTLAVTFLILALFVPTALGMVSDLGDDASAAVSKSEAGRVGEAAKRAYYSGAGSSDKVSVSLPGGSCLVIGGEGSDSYCITVLLGDSVAEKVYMQRPPVKFLGDPVYLMGERTVSIECVFEDGVYGVRVSVLD